eukprot:1162067-Pelagomonas_calceolata.AAC.10
MNAPPGTAYVNEVVQPLQPAWFDAWLLVRLGGAILAQMLLYLILVCPGHLCRSKQTDTAMPLRQIKCAPGLIEK